MHSRSKMLSGHPWDRPIWRITSTLGAAVSRSTWSYSAHRRISRNARRSASVSAPSPSLSTISTSTCPRARSRLHSCHQPGQLEFPKPTARRSEVGGEPSRQAFCPNARARKCFPQSRSGPPGNVLVRGRFTPDPSRGSGIGLPACPNPCRAKSISSNAGWTLQTGIPEPPLQCPVLPPAPLAVSPAAPKRSRS